MKRGDDSQQGQELKSNPWRRELQQRSRLIACLEDMKAGKNGHRKYAPMQYIVTPGQVPTSNICRLNPHIQRGRKWRGPVQENTKLSNITRGENEGEKGSGKSMVRAKQVSVDPIHLDGQKSSYMCQYHRASTDSLSIFPLPRFSALKYNGLLVRQLGSWWVISLWVLYRLSASRFSIESMASE